MQQMSGVPAMGAADGGMAGLGGMNPLQMLGAIAGGGGGSGGASSPFDAIGKAIAGAAAMGLIPGSGAQGVPNTAGGGFNPNAGPYGQMQAGMGAPGGMRPGMFQQQRGGGFNIPGAQMTKRITRQMGRQIDRGIQRSMGTALNRGMSRIHW